GPKGVAVDSGGDLYVADTANIRVLEYDALITDGKPTARVFGQTSLTIGICFSTPAANLLCGPSGMALDSTGKLYIADSTNNRVLEYDSPLTSQSANIVFGQGDDLTTNNCNKSAVPAEGRLCAPTAVVIDAAGNVYIA